MSINQSHWLRSNFISLSTSKDQIHINQANKQLNYSLKGLTIFQSSDIILYSSVHHLISRGGLEDKVPLNGAEIEKWIFW